jgi:hypothetical protein
MDFGQDEKAEFKKSIIVNRYIWLKDLMKVGLYFVNFAWMKVSKRKPMVNLCLKRPYFYPKLIKKDWAFKTK